MSALYASVGGVQIVTARITFPQFGIWHGDVTLALPNVITGDVTIAIGNLTLQGHAYRAASFAGARSVRVVGGHGGWQQDVPAQSYELPGGIAVSQVLGDVAKAVGETLVLAQDSVPWTRYVRERMPGSRILNQVLGSIWWIDVDGTTKTAARDTSAIGSDFQAEEYSGARGKFSIATEAPEDWMPGRTFTSPTISTPQTISSMTLILENSGKARLDVLTNTADINAGDRLYAEIASLIREALPSYTFHGVYEYSVNAVESGTLDASPVDTTLGLPTINVMPQTFALATATPRVGDLIRVWFVNGSPSRPEVCSAPATSTAVTVGSAAPAAAARNGDAVKVVFDVDDLTALAANLLCAGSGSSPTVIASPTPFNVEGTITQGSTQVQIG